MATASTKALSLTGWRGERVAAQAVLSTPTDIKELSISVSDLTSGKNVIPASSIKRYFVRYTLTDEFERKETRLMADRLEAADKSMAVSKNTTRPLWLDIRIPANAAPGKYKGTMTVSADGQKYELPYTVQVIDRVLPAPKDWAFHLDLWQNPYAVARYYQVPLWSKEHFEYMRPIMTMLAEAGQKVITTSIIQHPWNSQTYDPFESMIAKMKQLDGTWKYDYTVFDKWVEFMMSCGITEQIDCYTLVPWSYKFDYYDCASNSTKMISCEPTTKEYRDMILPFLKDFTKHLKQKGWFERTCIAMDERPIDQMNAVFKVVKEADPNWRIEGAANYDINSELADNVYDISVAYQYKLVSDEVLQRRASKGQKITFYTCCGPDRPNTFTFSNPAESAYMGWHSYACNYFGYLRWAYCSWPVQPNQDSRFGGWYAGDTFLAYPGCSSIRLERLVEGIQAYEKLRILEKTNPEKIEKIRPLIEKFRHNRITREQDVETMVNEAKNALNNLK